MHIYVFLFLLGAVLGLLACEFADRWGCSQKYRSSLPKKLFIVFTSGIATVALYWWEVQMEMLMPHGMQNEHLLSQHDAFTAVSVFVQRYIIHLILFWFLLVATLTDFYEMVIPDWITVSGTVTALIAAVFFRLAGLPVTEIRWADDFFPIFVTQFFAMHVWSPNSLDPNSIGIDLLVMMFIMTPLWWFWCFAMLDRVWYTKLSFRKANAIFWRYLYRSPRTKLIIANALMVPVFFAVVVYCEDVIFFTAPDGRVIGYSGLSRIALLSSLVGMAFGMILVWGIRLVARWVLGIEAMGFGDVTLMGMIGAFLGWQAVLLIFFAAPFFGLVYGIVNLALGRGRAVPYGPFLCLATVVVVVFWSPIWSATAEYFAFGIETIGIVLLVLLVLFGGLLHVVHKIFSGRHRD